MRISDDLIRFVSRTGHLGCFRTILADPPWPSASSESRRSWIRDRTRPRYNTMKPVEIISMPVDRITAKDAVLVLWSTWMHLPLAMEIISAWGFRYCTGMPWLKVCQPTNRDYPLLPHHRLGALRPIYGPGAWFQHCTELILIARRGKPFGKLGNPRPARKGIIIAPRREHSRKPDELQDWIDAKFPGPKLELFARRKRAGWTCWGDEL